MISGQLYDSKVPYMWTSQMREHFPSTSALTSQSIYHGLEGGPNGPQDGPCQHYIVDYLASGDINWTDGTVCGTYTLTKYTSAYLYVYIQYHMYIFVAHFFGIPFFVLFSTSNTEGDKYPYFNHDISRK